MQKINLKYAKMRKHTLPLYLWSPPASVSVMTLETQKMKPMKTKSIAY